MSPVQAVFPTKRVVTRFQVVTQIPVSGPLPDPPDKPNQAPILAPDFVILR